MSLTEAFQLTLEFLILLFLFYLAFLKSYFQEKGKNLATKEDVEEITSLVESIKSQLQYSLQAKLNLKAEEHNALVDYFSKYHAWLSAITNCSVAGVTYENSSRLKEIRNGLDTLQLDFNLAAGKMELFVENAKISSQHHKLNVETLKFQGHAQKVCLEFEQMHLEVKQMMLATPPDQRLDKYQTLLEKERGRYFAFKEEQIETYKALAPLVHEQRLAISAHLRDLIEK